MKFILLLGLLVLVIGCSSKVVRIDNPSAYQQQATVLEVPEQQTQTNVTQNAINADTSKTTNTKTSSSSASSSSETSSNTQREPINPSEEYITTNCCDEGRLFIQTKQKHSAYSEADIKNILIASYSAHCDSLRNYVTQRTYLRYSGEIQDSSYLTFFKGIEYKKIQVDYKTVSSSFEGCN